MIHGLWTASPETLSAALHVQAALAFGVVDEVTLEWWAAHTCEGRSARQSAILRDAVRDRRALAQLELERRRALEGP